MVTRKEKFWLSLTPPQKLCGASCTLGLYFDSWLLVYFIFFLESYPIFEKKMHYPLIWKQYIWRRTKNYKKQELIIGDETTVCLFQVREEAELLSALGFCGSEIWIELKVNELSLQWENFCTGPSLIMAIKTRGINLEGI